MFEIEIYISTAIYKCLLNCFPIIVISILFTCISLAFKDSKPIFLSIKTCGHETAVDYTYLIQRGDSKFHLVCRHESIEALQDAQRICEIG